MEYLLFIAYLVLFAWLVTRVKFFNTTGLSHPQLVIIFLLKVMAGIFYGWIGLYYGGLVGVAVGVSVGVAVGVLVGNN